jgi:phage tail-like protein
VPGLPTDPYQNFNFLVEIDGITQAGFSQVLMPDAYFDVVEYREGGDPHSSVRKLPGRAHYSNLVLKWGTTNARELFDWWKSIRDGNLDRRNISVVLLNEKREEVKRWNFIRAWPVRYKPADLAAKGNEVAIETLEIAHEGMDLA